ncbi:hypothetical protein [Klebsiella sp. BIGb0407]|uniref:hypothetical protein n=1 Tax=Klebsiella sp. BIGb0407 TaxID=2940603 RepID=UPI0038F69269|nr:hypothetical protein [Klebsiella sp. BIGb0407]
MKSVKMELALYIYYGLREIAENTEQRIHVFLRREGLLVSSKKIYRIYCLEGLNPCDRQTPERLAFARIHH